MTAQRGARHDADDIVALVDWDDAAFLENGYTVATCVRPDGATEVWLVAPLCGKHEAEATHGSVRDARHENAGRLGIEYRERVWGALLRCGRSTAQRRPCRVSVGQPGASCKAHRGLPRVTELAAGNG